MSEIFYLVQKPGRNFFITDNDVETVEESQKIKDLARKIFENPEILEAYELGNLNFSPIDIDDADKDCIIAEIERLIAQEKNSYVLECERDN